uniref:zinc finger protein 777-like n=1 Tax=Oncorhynchus gorbuscha TaxID=8017 RepID=UPI001EAE8D59|nr:zinc finger protein 777-like [Oncorhynchus gorbuscha]
MLHRREVANRVLTIDPCLETQLISTDCQRFNMERWQCGKPNPIKGEDTAVNVEDQSHISGGGDSHQEVQMDHFGHPLFRLSPSLRAEPVPQTLGHSDSSRLDEHLGVSRNVEEILDYWRLDPVCSPGGSKTGAGDPELLPVGNKTPTAMMDVPVFTLASQIDLSNGGVTCEPCDVKKVPTETKCSALTSLHIRSKEKQQSESSKKTEFDLSQCKSEIMSECPEMKVEDPIWSYYYQIESGITPVKKESLENATVAVKTKNEFNSEMKVEDPIWACYFAEQEKGVPNVERKTYAAHVKEEPVDIEIPFSFALGSSSPENEMEDGNGGLNAVKPAEEQSVKNSTETYYVKQEMVDIKNEDPIWANFHLNEVKDLKPKYDHLVSLLPSMIEDNHQPPIFKELLSLMTESTKPIHMVNVSVPTITGGQERTMTSDPKGSSQPISHQPISHRPSKKQRLECEPGDKSLASNSTQANTNQRSHNKPQQQDGTPGLDRSLPMPGIKHLPQTSNIYNKLKPSPTAKEIVNTCQLCGKSIASHKLSAEAVKGPGQTDTTRPWTCCVCKSTYKGPGQWVFHRQKHISGLKCLECGKCFKTQHSLEVHSKTHSKERPFSCEECGKTYRTLSLRNAHIYSCHTTPNHACQECGKSFRQIAHLHIHMNIHTGHRPYQCGDCKAAFKSPSALYTHKTIHTGEKPFVCPLCGLRFRLNAFLTVHLNTHTTTKGKLHNKSGKRPSKREQSDSDETSDSPSDATPQTPTARETRSQRKSKQVEN